MHGTFPQWLDDHISANVDALMSRMNREACSGIFTDFTLLYYPGAEPNCRGGICFANDRDSDELRKSGWRPVAGVFADKRAYALTRAQIRHRVCDAVWTLPILDPSEGDYR